MALPKKNKVDVNSLIDDSPQVQVDVMSLIDDGGEKKNRVGNGSGSGTPVIPPSTSPSKSTFGGSNFSLNPANLLNKEQEEPLLPQPRKREITPANLKEQKSFEQELFGISKYGTKTLRIDRGNIVNGVEVPEEIEIDPRTIPVSPYKNVTDDVFLGTIRNKLLQNQPLSKQEESFIRKNKNPVSKFTSDDDKLLQSLSGELGLAAEAIKDAKVPDLIGAIFPQIQGKTFGEIASSNEGKYSQIQTVKEKIKRDIELEESKRTGEKGETSDYEALAKLNSQLEDITALERKVSRRLAAVGEAGVEGTSRTDNTGSNWERFKKSAANLLFMGSAFIPEKADEDIELKVSQLPSQLITGLNYTKYAEPVEFERVSRALAQGKPISETQIANLTNIGIDIEKERLKEDYNELKIDKPTFDAKSMELSIKAYDNLVGNKEVLRGFLSSGIAEYLDEIEKTKIQNNIGGSREFGQVFGMRWQYTDEEIDYAAKAVAKAEGLNIDDPRVKEAIQYLQDNEGAMIMQNSISKSGFTRDFFRGAAMPIRGIASTIEGVGKTSEEIYAEGQSQGNVNVSETPVKRIANSWEGTVGKVFEGAGQLGTQIGLSYLTGGAIGGAGKAILGRGGVAALEGEIALADMAAADLAGAGLYKGREFISTFMTSFGTTYDGKLKEAQTYTADDGKAMAVAGGLAGMEGVVETFLSPLDIARGVGKGLFGKSSTQKLINILDDAKILDKKSAIQEYLTGTLKAGLAGGKMIFSEIGEEEVIALSSYGANAMLNPNSESFQNRVLKDELFETGIQTGLSMVIPALFTGVGAFNTNNFAKGSLVIAAQNRQMMVDALDKNLADGLVTQDEYNKKLQIVNSASKANQELPLKADGSKLNSEEKANYIFSRVSEGALERKIEVSTDEAEKTILRSKIAEQQKSRETILKTPTNVQSQTTQNVSTQAQNNQGQQGQDNQTQNATPSQNAPIVIDEPTIQQQGKEEMTVAQLRAEEQKELAAAIPNIESYKVDGKVDKTLITDETELATYNEIFDRYDGLITPKVRQEKAVQEQVKLVQPTIDKVNNFDPINEKESEDAQNSLYEILDKNPNAAPLIEPLILKLQNYEFTSKTETFTATEKVPVEGAFAAKSKSETKPALEQSEGSKARVVKKDGTTLEGNLQIQDGQYVLSVPEGESVVIGEKAITDRDLKLPEESVVETPIVLDEDGNVSSVTFETKDGDLVTIQDPEKALDLAIQLQAQVIGEIPDAAFEKAYTEVERQYQIEVIPPLPPLQQATPKAAKTAAQEQTQSTLKTEEDAIQKQAAGEVPVQSRATVGETMEEGIPQAEPQSVAQEGEAKKEEGSVANPALQDVESTTKALEELYDKGESIIIEDRDIVYDTAETINFVDGKKVKALRASQTTGVYLPLDKLAERYHDAKSKGIENDLTKAIESLLSEEQTKPTEETQQQTGGATQTQASAATTTTAPPKTADAIKKENEKKIEDFNNKVDANAKSLIDFLTPKGMEAEQAAPAAKSKGVSVNNKSAISALEGKSKGKNKIIISAAKKAIKTLQSIFPDMDIVLHEDTDSYNEAMGLVNGGINTAGNFAYESDAKNSPTGRGRIDINLSMANARTVAHEVAHAIMLKKFGENPALFKNFRDKIAKILNESSNKALMDFANQYVDKQGNLLDVTYEEYLAELTGALSAGEGSISSTTLQKIAALINEVVSKLTNGVLKPFEDIKDTKQVVDFFSGISSVIREGKDVNTLSEDFSGLLYEPTPLNVTGTINNPLPSTNRKPTSKSSRGDFNLIPHPIIDKNTMVGKKYSVTMSDHTKVGEYKNEKTGVTVKDLMGGVFYPYIKGVKDAGIAWASVTTKAAREMVMNAVNQDVTLIYRMSRATGSRGNVNFNEIAFAELIAPVTNGTVTEKEFLSNLNNKLNTIANGTQLATGIYILGKYGVDTNEKISINKTKIVKVKDKNGKLVDKTIKVTDKNGDNVRVKVTKKEIPSLDALKKALSKESFSKRGGFWSTILKDSWSTKSTGEWYKFLEKNKVTSLEEIVNNLAEPEVDNANDHDVVAAIKIAPPEYDKNGNVKIYTTRKNLVNEEKGVYFIDAPNHPSYPYVVKGSPIGVLNEFNSIADYFPIINEWIKSGRLNSPYKAVETMGKELVEKLDPSQTTFANTTMVSKAQVVYDETGFISVPSMIEIVKSNDPTYLGGVMEHIEGMGKKLRTGRVNATDVAKSYLMAVSSIRSGDIGVDKFENSVGKNVDEVFLEPNNKIRTEGAMAFLLTTDEGKRFLKNVESGKIDTKDRTFISTAMKPFGMFGVGESKFENIFGKPSEKQINLTNINEFNSLLKGGVKNESELFDAVVKLKGISQAKVGFVSNFLGVGTRGVIDAREIQGWLRGSVFQGKRTVQEAEIEKQLTKSNKSLSDLQQEILKRMRIVGEAFGVNPLLAEYIGHHMIWDAVAKEKTTHDGLYLAMTQNENDFNDKLNKITSKSQKEGEANPALKDVESTAKDTFENREKIEDGLKELGSDVYYHGSSDISYLNSKDDISTIYNTKNAKSKYLNLSPKAGVAVSYSISEQKIGEKSGVAAFKLKGKGYTMKNSDINNLKTNEAYEAFYDNKKAEGYDYVKVPQDANDIVVLNNNAIDYVDKKLNSESLLSKEQTENNGATATAANQPVSTTEGTTQQQGGQEAVQQGTTDAGQGGATTATTVQPNTDDAVKKATTSKSQEANPASVADIVNEASKIIKTAYAASQNVKEAVQKGLDYFIANWNENELGELPVEALRARLEAEFEVETEKTVKEVADDVRNDKISYNDAIEGKSDTFISELDKELFGSSKFSFEEQAFKEGVRRQKMAGLTEQEISDNYAALKKLTKRQKEIISEVFLETAQSDKMAKELQEAFASLAEGQKPKSVLERLAVSDVTALVNALKNALTYNAISNKQLEEMADFIVNAIDLKDADKYINALISREVADVRQLVRAKLIVKLQDLGNNELATQLINEMADEATLSGRQTQSLIKAYEILNAKGNPSTKAAFQKRYADAVQKQAREMNKDLSKALTDKEVEIGRLNERLHQATQKSSKMSKLKEVIAKLCGLRNK
jgi:hypothetical protein